jgi:hypothetical protein
MKRAWNKLGRLYCPDGDARHPKLLTHAANPLAIPLEGDVYRVFFSGRDSTNRSSVGAVDVDIVRRRVVREHSAPFFEHGPAGSFYADGVSIGNWYETSSGRYLLFMGWQNPPGEHWRGEIGRLRVGGDLQLALDGDRAFMPLNAADPVSLSYPWVLRDEPGGGWKMWYGSTRTWDGGNGEMVHVINQASSKDGDHWFRQGLAVPFELGKAQAFSRPTVIMDETGYHMWFSYRSGMGETYRIGYAQSENGRAWTLRLEEAGIDVSAHGWDAEMIEYPFVFQHRGLSYMLYNGNDYGATGFGLAVRDVP